MDAPEPDTPFAAVSAQTTRFQMIYQSYLDKSTPYVVQRWVGTAVLFVLFGARIVFAQGWYIVAYSLGIYLLNLFLAFISPKFDPSLEADTDMEDGVPAGQASSLPTKNDQEFKPFVRRLPEFKFWHSATRAIAIAFACCWSEIFNLPVFWPVLVMYWLILVFLTMRRQIQSMIKYRWVLRLCSEMAETPHTDTGDRYVPWDFGKTKYSNN